MTKKNYLVIGATILFFAAVIIIILLAGNKNAGTWTKDILNAQSYQITMKDCNGREKILDNKTLNELSNKWNTLSNNGPWTGDSNSCYTTVTISFENNGIVNNKKIVITDASSVALIDGSNSIYYTKAENIINYLNTLFSA